MKADDLLQEGSIGLLRAVYSFRPEKGYLFQTFASLVSKNMMMDYVRKCASAILDRLLHHSHIVNIVGPSYWTKDVLEKLEESKKKEYQAT
ncbi:sigma factor [Sharpea azabuensis]|uniref:sigma factor n=1 Tax=Sharpea azabuensis TaxID=322505 RepID=UPI0034E00FA0